MNFQAAKGSLVGVFTNLGFVRLLTIRQCNQVKLKWPSVRQSAKKRRPSLQLVSSLTSHVKDNITDLGWSSAKFPRPHCAFLTLHVVSYLAGLMSLHSSNGTTPACEVLFSFAHDLLSSRNQCFEKDKEKGLCSIITPRSLLYPYL